MISLKRTNQGGAIRTYIVIGVLLAVVTIGSAWFVRQRGQQVRQDQAIALADSQKKDSSSNQTAANTAVNVPADKSSNNSSTSDTNTAGSTTPQAGQQAGELPTTGPESGVQQIIFSALVTGSAVAYFSSRRVARSTL